MHRRVRLVAEDGSEFSPGAEEVEPPKRPSPASQDVTASQDVAGSSRSLAVSRMRAAVAASQATAKFSNLGQSIARAFGTDENSSVAKRRGSSGILEASLRPRHRKGAAIAEIAFDSGTSQYCLISDIAKPEDLFEAVLLPEWGLQEPKLLLSIMGGAGKMKLCAEKFDIDGFSKGLVEAATRTCAWVITGGTASGVMDIVGKAMKEHDKQRQVPCIGITPFGGLTTKWRAALDSAYDAQEASDFILPKVDAATARRDEGEKPETDGKIPLAAIQENHSHFIICDNGQVGSKAFGSEISFRASFEDHVTLETKDSSGQSQVPRVMILVNGGKISLHSLVKAIETGCPLVVCQGTGRIADVICSILQSLRDADLPMCPTTSESSGLVKSDSLSSELMDPELQHSEMEFDDTFRELLTDAVQAHMPTETLQEEEEQMAFDIVNSGMVEVYSIDRRLEDVILSAVLSFSSKKHQRVSVGQQLALAVQWGCTDYYNCLGTRLVRELGDDEKEGPQMAIQLIFNELVGIHQPAKAQGRMQLSIVRTVKDNAGDLVAWLLQHYLKQMDRFEVCEATLGKVQWNSLSSQDSWKSLEGLLLWSIEQEASSSVLETIWLYMEDPVHAALAAASACRETAQRKHGYSSYQDGLARQDLHAAADRFERLAVLVLEEFAQAGRGVEYIFHESERWQASPHCFRLAHQLGCKMFVSANFYRQAVDLYLMTPCPFGITKKQLDAKYQSWWKLLGLTVNFKECGFNVLEFLSIPYIKAWTHAISRCTFVGLYSNAVFYRTLTSGGVNATEVLLFFWGVGYAAVEIQQLRQIGSFQAYIRDFWNFLDSLHITSLLVTIILGHILADRDDDVSEVEHTLEVVHAVNLLPCWIRVLQILQLSEYFGTLLITIFGMAKDALKFFTLVIIFCFGFSCAITPILFPNGTERDKQGLTWALWTIVGDLDDKVKEKLQEDSSTLIRLVAHCLLYTLALVCNVLLVNLLIAVMNSTYEQNQAMSQTEWAFYRVNAVLEFDEAAILPPPFNLLESLIDLRADPSEDDADQNAFGRSERRRRGHEMAVTKRDLKDAQQRAFRALSYEEDVGESAQLRAELTELRRRNQELQRRNIELEGLAATYLLEQSGLSRAYGDGPRQSISPIGSPVPAKRRARRLLTTPALAVRPPISPTG